MAKNDVGRLEIHISSAKDALEEKHAYAENIQKHEEKCKDLLLRAGREARDAVEKRKCAPGRRATFTRQITEGFSCALYKFCPVQYKLFYSMPY